MQVCICTHTAITRLIVKYALYYVYFNCAVFPPAPSIGTAGFRAGQFMFSWSPVSSNCSTVHFSINASNCGNCPTTTNHTNVTRTDVPTSGGVCSFAIQILVCGGSYNSSNVVYISEFLWQIYNISRGMAMHGGYLQCVYTTFIITSLMHT